MSGQGLKWLKDPREAAEIFQIVRRKGSSAMWALVKQKTTNPFTLISFHAHAELILQRNRSVRD